MDIKTFFIASAAFPEMEEYVLSVAAAGTNVFLTGTCAHDANTLIDKISEKGASAYYYNAAGSDYFSCTADAVVACAEKFGGIDLLIFGESHSSKTELFLDMSEKDFACYTGMLQSFFWLCKCALPYMLGREKPAVVMPVEEDHEPRNIARAMYRAACLAMLKNMADEFKSYGIEVRPALIPM